MQRLTSFALAVALAACAQTGAADAPRPSVVPAAADAAHTQQEELLDRLAGHWLLTGTIAGEDTVHDVEAEWVLQRRYVRLHEVSRERGDNGLPADEAEVFIGIRDGRYVCIWLDNTEVAAGGVTCSAPSNSDSMPFEFRDTDGALIFVNTFTYHRAEDSWQWRLLNVKQGAESEFANVTLRRQ